MEEISKYLDTIKKYASVVGKRERIHVDDIESYCCLEFVKLLKKNAERYERESQAYINSLIFNICMHGAIEYNRRMHYTTYYSKKREGKNIVGTKSVDFALWAGNPHESPDFELGETGKDYLKISMLDTTLDYDLVDFLLVQCCTTRLHRKMIELLLEGKSVPYISHYLDIGIRKVQRTLNIIESEFINGTKNT